MSTITTLNCIEEVKVEVQSPVKADEQLSFVRNTELLVICGGSGAPVW